MASPENPLDAFECNNATELDEVPADCHKHGPYIKRRRTKYFWMFCPKCYEEQEAEREAIHRKEVAERENALRLGRLERSGLKGTRFEGASFENFRADTKEQRAVVAACEAYAQAVQPDYGAGLILVGPPGTGKSHLLSAIVHHVIEQRKLSAAVVTSRDVLRRLRATWQRDARESESDVLAALIDDLSVLALDEVGVGFGSEGEQVQLLDLIDGRYKRRRPTLIASNLGVPDLRTALGERAFDRLREGARVLPCTWASHRGARA